MMLLIMPKYIIIISLYFHNMQVTHSVAQFDKLSHLTFERRDAQSNKLAHYNVTQLLNIHVCRVFVFQQGCEWAHNFFFFLKRKLLPLGIDLTANL